MHFEYVVAQGICPSFMFTMEICYLGNSQSLRQGKKYIYICLYISHTQICSSAIVTLKRLIYLLSSPVTGKSVLFFHFKNANYPNNYWRVLQLPLHTLKQPVFPRGMLHFTSSKLYI